LRIRSSPFQWRCSSLREKEIINIVVVSKRDENYCYEVAAKRKKKYKNKVFKDSFKEK
jgi:mRNA interferase RelE/StbE